MIIIAIKKCTFLHSFFHKDNRENYKNYRVLVSCAHGNLFFKAHAHTKFRPCTGLASVFNLAQLKVTD